jgi:hypothetical protein
MTVLLKLLESGFYVDKRYKLIMRRDDGGWRDQHKLEKEHNLNQQQNLDLGQRTLKLKYAKAMARMVVRHETNMAVDYGTKAKIN